MAKRAVTRSGGGWVGFRATIGFGLIGPSAVLVANLALLGWALSRPDSGVGTRVLFQGDCSDTQTRSVAAHLVINVLGTLLLASSNAAMQALCAPLREDLDAAHARGSWLYVGVGNLRNFLAIGKLRQAAWLTLLLSSIPLHLLYNSVIIQSSSASEYYAVLVTQDFGQGVPIDTEAYNGTGTAQGATDLNLLYQIQNETAQYQKLSLEQCLQDYGTPFVQRYSNVVLVSNVSSWEDSKTNSSVLFSSKFSPNVTRLEYNMFFPTDNDQTGGDDFDMLFQPYLLSNGSFFYNEGFQMIDGQPQQAARWTTVDHCLAKQVPGACALELHPVFLIVVIAANAFKLACFVWLLCDVFPKNLLLTVDDAIASFLTRPDAITEGGIALARGDLSQSDPKRICMSVEMFQRIQKNGPPPPALRVPWCASRKRWIASLTVLQTFALFGTTVLWFIMGGVSVHSASGQDPNSFLPKLSLAQSFANGFGNAYPSNVLSASVAWGISCNILFANAPQLVVSLVYVIYNQIISQMHATSESMRFADRRDGLRVSSSPTGAQRASYWLSLPLSYALPLMAASAVLHWSLSQSLFLAEIVVQNEDGTIKPPEDRITAVGYSLVGLVIMLIVGGVMFIFLITYSCVRRLPSGMPSLGTCSLSIAAACHADRPGEAEQMLRYGVVKITGEKTGRVGLSSGEVEPLQNGWYYDGNDVAPRPEELKYRYATLGGARVNKTSV